MQAGGNPVQRGELEHGFYWVPRMWQAVGGICRRICENCGMNPQMIGVLNGK